MKRVIQFTNKRLINNPAIGLFGKPHDIIMELNGGVEVGR